MALTDQQLERCSRHITLKEIGPMAGIIGTMQALEAVKYITGQGELLTGSMLVFDGLKMKRRIVKLPKRNTLCPICGDTPTITELADEEQVSCSLRPQ